MNHNKQRAIEDVQRMTKNFIENTLDYSQRVKQWPISNRQILRIAGRVIWEQIVGGDKHEVM